MQPSEQAYLNRQVERIEARLMELNADTEETKNQRVALEAMRYSLEAGGKRIRPVLVLEFCKICSGNDQIALDSACALEMIHTFSLIHDDLPEMDNDDFRRGKPSCHKQFGTACALQAGDGMMFRALEVILEDENLTPQQKISVAKLYAHNSGVAGMVGGQVLDMAIEEKGSANIEELTTMCGAKTGALIRSACVAGVILGGGSQEQVQWADLYAAKLGLAFQIVDDILDVTSTMEQLGKPIGSDAEEGKSTFVTLLGLEQAKAYADQLTKEAMEALKKFENNAFLMELTQELLERQY